MYRRPRAAVKARQADGIPTGRSGRAPVKLHSHVLTFRVGPFPVTIEASFLLMAVFFGYDRRGGVTALLSWVLVVFVSVLVHELGHAVFGRRLGARPQIYLRGMGGLTLTPLSRRLGWAESVGLSLSGPLAGLLPGLLAGAVLWATNPAVQALAHDPALLLRLAFQGLDGRSPFEERTMAGRRPMSDRNSRKNMAASAGPNTP